MNSNLEQKLWNAGLGSELYSKDTWYEIIDALLDDFQKIIGQDFERDPEIRLYTERIKFPSFGRWMWSNEKHNSPLLYLKTGESVLEFVFERQPDGHGYWRSFGWCDDEWGEWESVKYE